MQIAKMTSVDSMHAYGVDVDTAADSVLSKESVTVSAEEDVRRSITHVAAKVIVAATVAPVAMAVASRLAPVAVAVPPVPPYTVAAAPVPPVAVAVAPVPVAVTVAPVTVAVAVARVSAALPVTAAVAAALVASQTRLAFWPLH